MPENDPFDRVAENPHQFADERRRHDVDVDRWSFTLVSTWSHVLNELRSSANPKLTPWGIEFQEAQGHAASIPTMVDATVTMGVARKSGNRASKSFVLQLKLLDSGEAAISAVHGKPAGFSPRLLSLGDPHHRAGLALAMADFAEAAGREPLG